MRFNSDKCCDAYQSVFREYKNPLRIANRHSWRLFCGQVDRISKTAKIKKKLLKDHMQAALIVYSEGCGALNMEDSIKILLDTYLPRSDARHSQLVILLSQDDAFVFTFFVHFSMVTKAFNSFTAFKAAGTEGIFRASLQNGADLQYYLTALLVYMYIYCLCSSIVHAK